MIGTLLALAAVLAAAAPPAGPAEDRLAQDAPRALVHRMPAKQTRCAACHTEKGWRGARFNHDKTRFSLKGAHAAVSCRACHPESFEQALPRTCKGCHRDPHTGSLGQRCSACHEETSWRTSFNADAHQKTNFPLSGRHAAMPCEECHFDQRDRAFTRATVSCAACHQKDYERAALTSLNHAAMCFSTDCKTCHSAVRWALARYPAHDACFPITSGDHASIPCLSCHTTLTGAAGGGTCNTNTAVLTCSTNTAACTGCHEHTCARTDPRHSEVQGYQCKDRKCYECHRNAAD